MRDPIANRRRKDVDVAKADYSGEILEAPKDEHYTKVFLKSVRGEAKEILAGAKPQNSKQVNAKSLYGLNPQSVVKCLKDPGLKSWKDFDAYSETMLGIALNVPVRYYDEWIPESLRNKVRDLRTHCKGLSFRVFYDGTELGKPTVLEPGRSKRFSNVSNFPAQTLRRKDIFMLNTAPFAHEIYRDCWFASVTLQWVSMINHFGILTERSNPDPELGVGRSLGGRPLGRCNEHRSTDPSRSSFGAPSYSRIARRHRTSRS